MNEKQFNEISAWQKETFGQATPLSQIAHLCQELSELSYDLVNKRPDRRLEYADCFILLFGSAAFDGMTYQDVCNAIREKHEINLKRRWGAPDENGVVNHIRE